MTSNTQRTGRSEYSLNKRRRLLPLILVGLSLVAPVTYAVPVLTADFDSNDEGFNFVEDQFGFNGSNACQDGVRVGSSPINGNGALDVRLGDCGTGSLSDLTGAWTQTFTLTEESTVTFDFLYQLEMAGGFENDEFSQVILELEGTPFGTGGNPYVVQLDGPNGIGDTSTSGNVSIPFGTLAAGTYTFVLGAYNNQRTVTQEVTTLYLDDIVVDAVPTTPTFTTTTIAGTVFYDLDASMDQNGIEVGLWDAQVNLHAGNSCMSPVIETTLTAQDGGYFFTDLDPGTYCVSVWEGSLVDGYQDTTANNPTVLTVADMEIITDLDFGFEATTCLPDIEWETDAAGNTIDPGQIIDDEYEPWGVSITAVGNGNGTINDIAMIFDSANPTGGDPDVGTPNEDFGGPGMGAEGGSAFLGSTANSHPEGNVLIISEDGDQGDPDDNGSGGVITFVLDREIEFAEATLVDVEDDCGGGNTSDLFAYGDVGATNLLGISAYPDLEDNGVSPSTLDVAGVRRVDGDFCASGAIIRMRFCISPTNRTNAVGDRIWYDVDQDGVQDIGEPGLGNVQVTLYDAGLDGMQGTADDFAVATTLTTETDGKYLFAGLTDGTYYVDVTDSTIPNGLSITAGSIDPTATATVMGGQTFLDLDIGYTGADNTAVVGDEVWSDADGDGLRDPGEPGIPGVTLDLVAPGPDGILGTGDDVVFDTTTTDAEGIYYFIAIAPAEYRVEVTDTGMVLTGYTLTTGVQSNPNPTDPIALIAGEAHLTADFGYQNPNLFDITDSVWYDEDQDGVRDAGEEGFFDVTMSLLDGNGVLISSTTTDANGDFSFNGLPNGDYRLLKTDVSNVVHDFDTTTNGAEDGFHDLTIAGADVVGDNFGYVKPGTVGDYVFVDVNGNGVPEFGETGISGVTVTIHLDIDNNGSFDNTVDTQARITTVTNAAGYYLFENLIPGTYFVTVNPAQPALTGYTATTADEQLGGNAAGVQLDAVLVGSSPANTAASSVLDADFGFQNTALANISGNVWNDLDADGFDDGAGEPRIPGAQLDLLDDMGVVISTTFTDVNGDYSFNDLPDGDYEVAVNNNNGVLDGYRLTSGLDVIPVTLAGVDVTDVDFGYVRNSLTGLIGDYVWFDADRDGNQDPAEPGFRQVTVELYDVGPDLQIGGGDDVLVGTRQTDLNGNYVFMNLAEGKYYAQVDETTLPGGGADLSATTGTTNPTGVIDLAEGEQFRDADFGYAGTNGLSALGDEVWYDANSNGIREPGEPGLAGVTVELRDNMNVLLDTTVTDAAGYYLFSGLIPGTYTVVVDIMTLPGGVNTTPTNNGGSDTYTVPLSSDRDELYADWGFDGGTPGAIGDTVFLDLDANGTQDAGEEGIEDVTLNLVGPGINGVFGDGDDQILATDTTNADGMYLFSPLIAGDYRVYVTDVNNVLSALNLSPGSWISDTTISLSAGQNFLIADFGYSPSSFIGAVGNQVWHDLDQDGLFDLGEPGLEGVTLDIWVDNDNNGVIQPGVDNLLREVTTDFEGKYEFSGLLPENYLVTVTDRLGVLTGFTKTFGTPGLDNNSQVDPYAVTLSAGSPTNQTADFGYFAAGDLLIEGTVFIDADANGVLDMGETRVPNARLRLYRDLDGDGLVDVGEPIIDTQIADGIGDYLFDNLPPGDYVVVADVTPTIADGGEQTTQLSTSGVQPVELIASDSMDNDFGFVFRPTLAMISYLKASQIAGQVVVEFATHYETGVMQFDLHRVIGAGESTERVNSKPLHSSIGRDVAGTYRVVDGSVALGDTVSYLIEETELSGMSRFYGPFEVTVTSGGPTAQLPQGGSERIPVQPDNAERARLARAVDPYEQLNRAPSGGPDAFFADSFEESFGLPAGDGDALKAYIEQSGIYYIAAGEIAQALNLSEGDARALISDNQLALSNNGQSVAWHAEDDRGLFFYAQAIDSIYTRENVYWLEQGAAQRMNLLDVSPVGNSITGGFNGHVVAEQDAFAATLVSPDPESDYWHWEVMAASSSAINTRSFNVPLSNGLATGNPLLTVTLRGASSGVLTGSHRVRIDVDGQIVGYAQFSGLSEFEGTYAFDPTHVTDGKINITLHAEIPANQDDSVLFVDGFKVSYQQAYQAVDNQLSFDALATGRLTVPGFEQSAVYAMDISNPAAPRWMTGLATTAGAQGHDAELSVSAGSQSILAGALAVQSPIRIVGEVSSNLRDRENAVDYLMVLPSVLLEDGEALASLHQARGLRVMQVAYEDVLDEFSHGIATPHALADFLAHVSTAWIDAPDYVLLVGAGSFDYRDLNDLGGNLIPPMMAQTARGLYASDMQYADTNGDRIPEFALGRLPVVNAEELADITAKIESRINGGSSQSALLIADNPDNGGDFDLEIDLINAIVDGPLTTQALRGSVLDPMTMQSQIVSALGAGVSVVDYVGHGGLNVLAHESYLAINDVAGLPASGEQPVFLVLSCGIGRFEYPGYGSLAEALVLAPSAGALAVWSPSGDSMNLDAAVLNQAFAQAIAGNPGISLGQAIQQAYVTFAIEGTFPWMADIYNLLGDPSLPVAP